MGASLQPDVPEPGRDAPVAGPAAAGPAVAPGMGPAGARQLAGAIGNRAFSASVARVPRPGGVIQRDIFSDLGLPALPFPEGGVGDFLPRIGPFAPPAPAPPPPAPSGIGGLGETIAKTMKKTLLQGERDHNLRIRKQLNAQVIGQIETARTLIEQKPPAGQAADGVGSAAREAVAGFGLPERFFAQVEGLRNAIAEGTQLAFVIGQPRAKVVEGVMGALDFASDAIAQATAVPPQERAGGPPGAPPSPPAAPA
ncbi:MAG: hypothetical protein AB1416_04945, partial [Actinomycetota bacterium]